MVRPAPRRRDQADGKTASVRRAPFMPSARLSAWKKHWSRLFAKEPCGQRTTFWACWEATLARAELGIGICRNSGHSVDRHFAVAASSSTLECPRSAGARTTSRWRRPKPHRPNKSSRWRLDKAKRQVKAQSEGAESHVAARQSDEPGGRSSTNRNSRLRFSTITSNTQGGRLLPMGDRRELRWTNLPAS